MDEEGPIRDSREHLEGLPGPFAELTDVQLSLAAVQFPVHSVHLARYSGHAAALLSSLGDGVARGGGQELAAALSAPLASCEPTAANVTAFLRLLYALPSRKAVADVLCSMHREEGSGEVVFTFQLEPVLQLAKAYDCPDVFTVCEQALLEEPLLKLAVLMSPLRWLLLFEDYQHMGYFLQARSAAIAHLSAKFAALQRDPLLTALSPGTLADLVRMLGHRLEALSQTCCHARAVQDRQLQRFTSMANEVAAPFCPDPLRASSFVTHWAISTNSTSIKLSWTQQGGAAAQQPQHAQQAQQEGVEPEEQEQLLLPQPAGQQAQQQHADPLAEQAQHALVGAEQQPPAQAQQLAPAAAAQAALPHLLGPAAAAPGQLPLLPPLLPAPLPPHEPPRAAEHVVHAAHLAGTWQALQHAQAVIAQQEAALHTLLLHIEVLHKDRTQQARQRAQPTRGNGRAAATAAAKVARGAAVSVARGNKEEAEGEAEEAAGSAAMEEEREEYEEEVEDQAEEEEEEVEVEVEVEVEEKEKEGGERARAAAGRQRADAGGRSGTGETDEAASMPHGVGHGAARRHAMRSSSLEHTPVSPPPAQLHRRRQLPALGEPPLRARYWPY